MTPSPLGSTFQPMMSRLSGHMCSPAPSMRASPPSPLAHDTGCRAVAEQGGRHHVGGGKLVHAEGRGADLDGHQQHRRARPGARQAAGDGEARHAAGAAQAEHRHALDIGAEAHAACDPRLEAGRGDAGRGHGDDGVDVAALAAGVGERAARRIDEERLRALEIGRVALRPAEIGQDTSRAASRCGACGCPRSRTPAPCARKRHSDGRRSAVLPRPRRTAACGAAARHGRPTAILPPGRPAGSRRVMAGKRSRSTSVSFGWSSVRLSSARRTPTLARHSRHRGPRRASHNFRRSRRSVRFDKVDAAKRGLRHISDDIRRAVACRMTLCLRRWFPC